MNKASDQLEKEKKVKGERKFLRPLVAVTATVAATIPIAIHFNVAITIFGSTPLPTPKPLSTPLPLPKPEFNQEAFAQTIEQIKTLLSQQPLTRADFKKADEANWQAFYILLGKPLYNASPTEITSLSCDALRAIDNSWKAAKGYELGIGVQAAVFEEVGKDYDRWKEKISWTRFGTDTQFSDLHEPSNVIKGSLPIENMRKTFAGRVNYSMFAQRVSSCLKE